MPKKNSTDPIALEIGGSIRDMALDQMAQGLANLGVSQAAIDKARKECVRLNSDKPFADLAKTMLLARRGGK